MSNPRTPDEAAGTTPRQENQYDPHIVPAETGARMDREGQAYKHIPNEEDKRQEDPDVNEESIHTTGGFTVDKEGLVDNFAVEPEMYYETPGDRREIKEQEQLARAEELEDVIDDDEEGRLTMEKDQRGKGPGII